MTLATYNIYADASTPSACPPCATSSISTAEHITNPACPGGTNGNGDYEIVRDLCRGCCYEIQDPGSEGKGIKNNGTYVNSAPGNSKYRCIYKFNVGDISGEFYYAVLKSSNCVTELYFAI